MSDEANKIIELDVERDVEDTMTGLNSAAGVAGQDLYREAIAYNEQNGVPVSEFLRSPDAMRALKDRAHKKNVLNGSPMLRQAIQEDPSLAGMIQDDVEKYSGFEHIQENPAGTGLSRAYDRMVLGMSMVPTGIMTRQDNLMFQLSQMTEEERARQALKDSTGLTDEQLAPYFKGGFGDVDQRAKAIHDLMGSGLLPTYWDLGSYYQLLETREGQLAAFNESSVDEILQRSAERVLWLKEKQEEYDAIPMSPTAARARDAIGTIPEDAGFMDSMSAIAQIAWDDPAAMGAFMGETSVESSGPMVAAIVIGAVTRNPQLAFLMASGGNLGLEVSAEMREALAAKGIKLETEEDAINLLADTTVLMDAVDKGVMRAAIISAVDILSMGVASKALSSNPYVDAIAQLGVSMLSEGAGEAAAMQVTEGRVVATEAILEGLIAGPMEAVVSVPGMRRATSGKKARGVIDAHRRTRGKAGQGIEQESKIRQLNQMAENADLRDASPRAYRKFLKSIGFSKSHIHVDANALIEAVGDDTTIVEALGVSQEELASAAEGGRTVPVQLVKYVDNIPGRNSKVQRVFEKNATLDPDQLTRAQSDQFVQEEQGERETEVQAAIDEEIERVSFRAEIEEMVNLKLREAGKSNMEAIAGAQLHGAFFETMAERFGNEDAMRRYGMAVTGPATSQRQGLGQAFANRQDQAQLNVGLADPAGGPDLDPQIIRDAIAKVGGVITGENMLESDSEMTLIPTLEQPLTPEQLYQLSEDLGQEAVAQWRGDGTGDLQGPNAAGWGGAFAPEYFMMFDGTRADQVARDLGQPIKPTRVGDPAPVVEGQSDGVGNVGGFMPHLRVKTKGREGKPHILTGTNEKNAQKQLDALDDLLIRHPDPLASPEAWAELWGDALASDDVVAPPYNLIKSINSDRAAEMLSSLSEGQLADRDHGFANAKLFRKLYTDGKVTPVQTAKLFLWSFLSRSASPYTQEGMFLDAYYEIDPFIEAAARGEFNVDEYLAWSDGLVPKGSGVPGAAVSHNLNAFGRLFLERMSQDAGDGRSKLQVIHDMMSDGVSSGKAIRRKFAQIGQGVGIDNKVMSFTLLVAGFDDVIVLDRVQFKEMWNDGRFGDLNLYDGYSLPPEGGGKPKPVSGSGLQLLGSGVRGILAYEAIEQSLHDRIADIYEAAGRPQDASIGGYHWDTWVASSGQEASHGTLDAMLYEIQGREDPMSGVFAKEGEYGKFQYGAQYSRSAAGQGNNSFVYEVPDRGVFQFTVEEFNNFQTAIKDPANGVVPKGFKVTKDTHNAPWFKKKGVSLDALAEQAAKFGAPIERSGLRRSDVANGADEVVPDRPAADQSSTAQEGRTLAQSQDFYFADTEVRDADGDLLPVYHSTRREDIEGFQPGSHFGTSQAANDRLRNTRPSYNKDETFYAEQTYPVYLNITNPIYVGVETGPRSRGWGGNMDMILQVAETLERDGEEELANELYDVFNDHESEGGESEEAYAEEAMSILEVNGYDGVVYENIVEDPGSTSYVIFSPEQAKSVNNLNPTSDPSMMHQDRRGQIVFNPEGVRDTTALIQLFGQNDESTFAHESAHFFLEIYKDLVTNDAAPQQMNDDWAALTKWMGIEEGVTEIPEAAHEKFAEAFEVYLMEGRAPSPSLKVVFHQFSRWLTRIYTQLTKIGAQPSDEVRAVMDRMLATDDEIELARAELDTAPLFETLPPYTSEDEWKPYQKLIEREQAETHGRVLEKAMAKIKRARTVAFKRRVKEVSVEIADSKSQERSYQLIDALGNQDVEPGQRMNKKALVDMAGEDALLNLNKASRRTKRNLYEDGGVPPQAIADVYGYDSVADMLEDLNATPPIQQATEEEAVAQVEKEMGDPNDEFEIREEAEASLKNGFTTERVARELDVVERAAQGGRGPNRWQRQNAQAKKAAEAEVLAMDTGKLAGYRQFLRASQLAARDARRALAKAVDSAGDITDAPQAALEEAAEALRRQLKNDHMYRVARENFHKVMTARKRFRKYSAIKFAKTIGAPIDPDNLNLGTFWELVQATLAQYDLRDHTAAEVKRRIDMRSFVNSMQNQMRGMEVAIPQSVMDELEVKSYEELSVSEMLALIDAVENMVHMGRQTNKQIAADEKFDRDRAVDEIVERLDETSPDIDLKRESTRRGRIWDNVRGYFLVGTNPDTMMSLIDGDTDVDSPAYKYLRQAVSDATSQDFIEQQEYARKIAAVYRKWLGTPKQLTKMFRDVRVFEGIRNDGKPEELSRLGLLMMAMNAGNRGNWERLTNKDGIATYDATAVQNLLRNELTENELHFLQDMWDLMNELSPRIANQQRKLTGVAPKMVEPEIMIPGLPSFVKGGYAPIAYDGRLSAKASNNELLMDGTNGKAAIAQTEHGFTNERLNSTGMALDFDLGVIDQHIMTVIHDLNLRVPLRDAWRLLSDQRLHEAMTAKGKQEDLQFMKGNLQEIAIGHYRVQGAVNRMFKWLRTGFTTSVLAFRMGTVLLQPLGLLQSSATVGKRAMAKGIIDYVRQGPANAHRMAIAASKVMAERYHTFERELAEMQSARKNRGPALTEAANIRDLFAQYGFVPIGMVQYWLVDLPTWNASYNKARNEGKSPEQAARQADRDVKRSQGSGIYGDMSAFEGGKISANATQNEFVKLFTTLSTYYYTKYNVMAARTKQTNFKSPAQVASWAIDMASVTVLEAAMSVLLRGALSDLLSGDLDDEDYERLAEEMGMSLLGVLPVGGREVAASLAGFEGGQLAGYVDTVSKAATSTIDLVTGEGDLKDLKKINTLGGLLLKYPSETINSVADAVLTKEFEVEDTWLQNLGKPVIGTKTGGTNE